MAKDGEDKETSQTNENGMKKNSLPSKQLKIIKEFEGSYDA